MSCGGSGVVEGIKEVKVTIPAGWFPRCDEINWNCSLATPHHYICVEWNKN